MFLNLSFKKIESRVDMELRNILSFLRVNELGSFSKAAESMGYAQSPDTMQIQQLEEELGKPLFDRFGRTVTLTDFGTRYLPLARQMYQTSQEMLNLSIEPEKLTGTIKIGIIESLFFSNFQQLLHKYQVQFPEVTLEFSLASSTELYGLLAKNKVDIICCLSDNLIKQRFVTMRAISVPVVFVSNPSNRLAKCCAVPLKELVQERFVGAEEIGIYQQLLLKLLADHGLTTRENVRLNSTRGIVEILKYSDGISFLPEYTVKKDVEQGDLDIIDMDIPQIDITVLSMIHKDKWISPQMRGMIHLLQNECWL